MKPKTYPLLFLLVLAVACSSNVLTLPTNTSTSVPVTLPSETNDFPYSNTLSKSLPKENLLLAVHYYSEAIENTRDEICYDVGVYNDDSYIVISCLSDFTYPAPTGSLDANQSKYLHRWVDTFQKFEDPTIRGFLKFAGNGTVAPEYSDKLSMRAMLGRLEWLAYEPISGGGTPSAVLLARDVLSHQLNLELDNVSVWTFEAVEFSNSCLDAPKPNEVCEQVITQGFRVYLVANDLMYEYHTDIWGYDIRPFGEPQPTPPPRNG